MFASFLLFFFSYFFFNDPATTEIYTLSLHRRSSDLVCALPAMRLPVVAVRVMVMAGSFAGAGVYVFPRSPRGRLLAPADRKSTRLNSSHMSISYAVFCLKKKKKKTIM